MQPMRPARAPQRPWLHMGGFALYTWILTYMMVWTGKDGLTLGLFALAMGLHLFTIASTLGRHYRGCTSAAVHRCWPRLRWPAGRRR